MCRESDEEEVSGSDAGGELGADEIVASDDSDVVDVEAPSRKRKAPQTALKVHRLPTEALCIYTSSARRRVTAVEIRVSDTNLDHADCECW